MSKKRQNGAEQPALRLGMFQIRIPFIHVMPTFPEALQAVCYSVLCYGSIATIISSTGVSESAAFAAAWFCVLLYALGYFSGDPAVSGWITPAIPMVLIYINTFSAGERIQALCALELTLAAVFFFMGITGLAKKIVVLVPQGIKAGILLGAALAAIYGEFVSGGRFHQMPVTCTVALGIGVFLLYSPVFKNWVDSGSRIAEILFKLGVVPALVVAMALAVITGEADVHFSLLPVIGLPDLTLMLRELSPFYTGFPRAVYFIQAIPTALAIYIIAFSDILVINGLVRESNASRQDEWVSADANRMNIVAGIRNLIMGLAAPFAPMCGPLGASNTITLHTRYKASDRKNFDSIHGGNASATLVLPIAMLLSPIVSVCRPCAPAITCICLVIQGFSCTEIGMSTCRDKVDFLVAGAIAGCMMAQGAAFGLAIGVICYLFFATKEKKKGDLSFSRLEMAKDSEGIAVG